MGINIKQMPLPSGKYSLKATNAMSPIGITIHETDNNAPAVNEITYMQRNDSSTSFHFAVDENEIIQGAPLDRNTWHAGDGNGNGNRKTISIEICRNYRTDDLTNYYKARARAEELVGYLLKQYGWDASNIYTHNDWSGKNCPRVIRSEGYLPTFKANAMKHKGGSTAEPILGKSNTTAAQLTAHVRKHNPSFDSKIAEAFIKFGDLYGIRGDVAFAQSILETGWFKFQGSSVNPSQNNFCGLGATGGGVSGASFSSIEEGVEAQMQHLWAYASKAAIPHGRKNVDPRFHLVSRGIAQNWIDLNGRWATGANYGQKILAIYAEFGSTPKPKPIPKPKGKTNEQLAQEVKRGDWGNGQDRKNRLTAAGYNYNAIQAIVNGSPAPKPKGKTNDQIANEVIRGDWGNGQDRKNRLKAAGYDYSTIQAIVNKKV